MKKRRFRRKKSGYDPDVAPNPEKWLALDEEERFDLVEKYHIEAGYEIEGMRFHAIFHSVVENQLALNDEPVVQKMLQLQEEGLGRHEALHAIMSVLATYFWEVMNDKTPGDYYKELEKLSKQSWYDNFG